MLKITFFGTTTLLFDDGSDQILFDAHFTRPSIEKYIVGAKAETNTGLCDRLISLHKIDRLRAVFISHTHHDHGLYPGFPEHITMGSVTFRPLVSPAKV